MTFSNVNQTTPIGNTVTTNTRPAKTAPSVAAIKITSNTNSLVFAVLASDSGNLHDMTSGQTARWNTNPGKIQGCGSTKPGDCVGDQFMDRRQPASIMRRPPFRSTRRLPPPPHRDVYPDARVLPEFCDAFRRRGEDNQLDCRHQRHDAHQPGRDRHPAERHKPIPDVEQPHLQQQQQLPWSGPAP